MQDPHSELLELLPDSPLWVEARGMLLNGRGKVLGFDAEPQLRGAVVQPDIGLAVLIGKPTPELVFQATEFADELICPVENAEYLLPFLPDWSRENASFLQLPATRLEKLILRPVSPETDTDLSTRLLTMEDLVSAEGMPLLLREELQQELDFGTHIFCATWQEKAVAFCFAAACSESLWDISIDSLPAYRRRGHAERCVRFAMSHMAAKGYSPVWGVVDSNRPSRQMAKKLGFEAGPRIAVFTRSA